MQGRGQDGSAVGKERVTILPASCGVSLCPEIQRPGRCSTQSTKSFSRPSWLLWGKIEGRTIHFLASRLFSLHFYNPTFLLFSVLFYVCIRVYPCPKFFWNHRALGTDEFWIFRWNVYNAIKIPRLKSLRKKFISHWRKKSLKNKSDGESI